MDTLKIPVLIGTGREGRRSGHIAAYVYGQAEAFGFDTELLDIRGYATAATNTPDVKNVETRQWQSKMGKADGLLIVVPEYNHGMPGELKILLDKAYVEYNRKPVGVVTVSSGGIGGARVFEHLLSVFTILNLVPMNNPVHVSNVDDRLRDGAVTEEARAFLDPRIEALCKELDWFGRALSAARE